MIFVCFGFDKGKCWCTEDSSPSRTHYTSSLQTTKSQTNAAGNADSKQNKRTQYKCITTLLYRHIPSVRITLLTIRVHAVQPSSWYRYNLLVTAGLRVRRARKRASRQVWAIIEIHITCVVSYRSFVLHPLFVHNIGQV